MTLLKIVEAIFVLLRVLRQGLSAFQPKMKKTSHSTVNFSRLALFPESFCDTEMKGLGATHSRAK